MSSREAFQINSLDDYHTIISSLLAQSDLKDFGNPYFLNINYDMLAEAVSLVTTTFKDELQKEIMSYSDSRLAYSFVYNTLVYALVNHRDQVGETEITGMLQVWSYVPVSSRSKMIKVLNEELFIGDDTLLEQTATRDKFTQKKLSKIIPFPSKK